jgi:hypothetical protein
MGTAVVNGDDLDVQMIVVAIELVVLDTGIREMDVLVEIREFTFTGPICNLLGGSIGAAAGIVAVTIVLVQPPLILPFEFVVEHNALDAGVTLGEALRGTQIGSVNLRIVFDLARLHEACIELLRMLVLARITVRAQQVAAAVGQHDDEISVTRQPLGFD